MSGDGEDPPELVEPPPASRRRIPSAERPDSAEPPPTQPTAAEPPPTQPTAAEPPPTQPTAAERTPTRAAGGREEPHPVFAIDSWLDAPAGTFPGLADGAAEAEDLGGDRDDLGRAFAADRFHEYDGDVLPGDEAPEPAAVSPYGMPPDDAPVEPERRVSAATVLVAVCIGVIAVVALAAAFAGGRAAALVGHPLASPSASPTPSPTPTGVPVALAAPGIVPWDRLGGGECLTAFSGPWANTFDVVPCSQQHTAQLVLRARFTDAADAAYPGAVALQQRMAALCTAAGVVDLSRAASTDDLQLSTAYPATRLEWEDGDRDYFCFVSRQSGAPISGSVAGTAQQAVWAARAASPSPSATSKAGK